eukprot:766980-Hanusia_phi.AAC.4
MFQDNSTVVENVLQALEHFSHCRNQEASEKKIELLKKGGIKFLMESLHNFPTNIAIKRRACDVRTSTLPAPLPSHSLHIPILALSPPSRSSAAVDIGDGHRAPGQVERVCAAGSEEG